MLQLDCGSCGFYVLSLWFACLVFYQVVVTVARVTVNNLSLSSLSAIAVCDVVEKTFHVLNYV